ncbi:MAG: hypothetical protein ACT6TH_15410 [Brevundimonas sp.]|uniref:hypothetical protein n=1 Tax=Brevundimonas sp. TaxID=1871086 RepID=UPI0040344895
MALVVTPSLVEAAAWKIAREGGIPVSWTMFDCREYAKLALTGAAEFLAGQQEVGLEPPQPDRDAAE